MAWSDISLAEYNCRWQRDESLPLPDGSSSIENDDIDLTLFFSVLDSISNDETIGNNARPTDGTSSTGQCGDHCDYSNDYLQLPSSSYLTVMNSSDALMYYEWSVVEKHFAKVLSNKRNTNLIRGVSVGFHYRWTIDYYPLWVSLKKRAPQRWINDFTRTHSMTWSRIFG